MPWCRPVVSRTIIAVMVGLVITSMRTSAYVEAAEPTELMKSLPENANAIAVVRVSEILNSPRAQRENWATNDDANLLGGNSRIPSWIETLMIGFLFRPADHEEVWASGIATMPEAISLESIAAREGGDIQQLSGFPTLRGSRNAFIVQLKPGQLAFRRPAIRQEAAHWLASLQSGRSGLQSEYLMKASQSPAPIVLAMDLSQMLDPSQVLSHLQADQRLADRPATIQKVADLLQSLQGVTFAAVIDDATRAEVRIDFGQSIGSVAPHLKNFFLDVLHGMGTEIEEFESSDVKADGNTLVVTTELGDDSLRRILSLLTSSPGASHTDMMEQTADTPATSRVETTTADNSRKYFQSVKRIIANLERANRKATNYERTATWHENFARNIDNLPIQGVDPELVDFGTDTSSRFRALARSLRGQGVEVNVQQRTLTYDVDFQPGWGSVNVWGGVGYGQPSYNVRSNLQQVRERQAAAVLAGAQQRSQIWQMITEDQAAIERKMREKYGDDFVR